MGDGSYVWRSGRKLLFGLPAPVRPTVPPGAPAKFVDAQADQRTFTEAHSILLRELKLGDGWSATALWSCLDHLRTSTVTEARLVAVEDAWVDGEDAFCVVYRPPRDAGRVVGVRRERNDAIDPGEWRLGDMTTWGYDLGPTATGQVDPMPFGWNVADFDIGEPLGYVATVLRADDTGVEWWGTVGSELPRRPQRRRQPN